MNGSQTRISMLVLLAFIGALILGAVFFLAGMQGVSYIVTNGVDYALRFTDRPRYELNLMGFIYTGAFLIAALLLMVVLFIPDERSLAVLRRPAHAAPQPRRRRPVPGLGDSAAAQVAQAAQALDAQAAAPRTIPPAGTSPPEPRPSPQAGSITDAAGAGTAVDGSAGHSTAPPPPTAPPVPEDHAEDAEMHAADLPKSAFDLSGEEDVIYGNGPVTQESILEFIQTYPDSAVKFLYLKNLDNRPLPPPEADIYERWERRGMTRAAVRRFILELMDWKRLPDEFPHEIWMQLRDRIYELQAKIDN